MKRQCRSIRSKLAAGGPAALKNQSDAQRHLEECDGCFAFLEALVELEDSWSAMPPIDAPDELVEKLLDRPELGASPATVSRAPSTHWELLRKAALDLLRSLRTARIRWGLVGVPAVLLIGVLSILTFRNASQTKHLGAELDAVALRKIPHTQEIEAGAAPESEVAEEEIRQVPGTLGHDDESDSGDGRSHGAMLMKDTMGAATADKETGREAKKETDRLGSLKNQESLEITANAPLVDVGIAQVAPEIPAEESDANRRNSASSRGTRPMNARPTPRPTPRPARKVEQRRQDAQAWQSEILLDELRREETGHLRSTIKEPPAKEPAPDLEGCAGEIEVDNDSAEALSTDIESAEAYLHSRETLDGIEFQEARGYWANTYVPGDRRLRRLHAQLQARDDETQSDRPHQQSHQVSQPFDPPEGSAIAVYLHADTTTAEARERVLLQVGIKGTDRRAGLRPALNIGLVLDLRGEIDGSTEDNMRALVAAFAQSADLGDRFSLTVAGRPGATVVPPGDFRYGTLTLALNRIFEPAQTGGLSLAEALALATETVRGSDDPSAPLGSSAIVLITGQHLENQTLLEATAHTSSVAGIPWSVVAVGTGVDLEEIDRLVLAGQGNRRLLNSADEAQSLVARELDAVGRVIARALRLRIELAPGVQLVDILGSENLDEARSQMVRDREIAIDRRLSKNLGIDADRGLDEAGIQIVIPSFYAGDSHVILLDVVVPGSGPVADVTARYKDLVFMKNGIAHDHLSLRRGHEQPGPLELNVLKNQLAFDLGTVLDRSAEALRDGQTELAIEELEAFHRLLTQLPRLIDGLSGDPDLADDMSLLRSSIDDIRASADPATLAALADSLEYAGRLKVLSMPLGADE